MYVRCVAVGFAVVVSFLLAHWQLQPVVPWVCLISAFAAEAWLRHQSATRRPGADSDPHADALRLLQHCAPVLADCAQNLRNVMTVQDDAVQTLSDAFARLDRALHTQAGLLRECAGAAVAGSAAGDHSLAQRLEQYARVMEQSVQAAVQGLQFSDINRQNLCFTAAVITELADELAELTPEQVRRVNGLLQHKVEQIRARSAQLHNPVSQSSMASGDAELF